MMALGGKVVSYEHSDRDRLDLRSGEHVGRVIEKSPSRIVLYITWDVCAPSLAIGSVGRMGTPTPTLGGELRTTLRQ